MTDAYVKARLRQIEIMSIQPKNETKSIRLQKCLKKLTIDDESHKKKSWLSRIFRYRHNDHC